MRSREVPEISSFGLIKSRQTNGEQGYILGASPTAALNKRRAANLASLARAQPGGWLQRARNNRARGIRSWARGRIRYLARCIWGARFRARHSRALTLHSLFSASYAPRAPAPANCTPWTHAPAPRSPHPTAATPPPPPPPPQTLARGALASPPSKLLRASALRALYLLVILWNNIC